jgi:hypothetical protein
MNTQQAKFILQGYRPDGADAGDATFAEALEQARHDLVLRDWFAREQAFDAAVSAKLGEVQAPAGLREAILAGARVTAPGTSRRSWWHQPAWLAVAAGVALLAATTLALWPKPAVAGGPLLEFALTDARHSETHGGHGVETGVLQAMLSQPTTHLGDGLPVDFATLRRNGCRTVSFEGHDLLEVCFQRDGVWFHCYIAQRGDFSSLAMAAAPALVDRNGASIASWADASHLYVVVSKTGRAALERLL